MRASNPEASSWLKETVSRDWSGKDSDTASCRDCAAARGELHVPFCCWEQCPSCGGQAIGCGCAHDDQDDDGEVQE